MLSMQEMIAEILDSSRGTMTQEDISHYLEKSAFWELEQRKLMEKQRSEIERVIGEELALEKKRDNREATAPSALLRSIKQRHIRERKNAQERVNLMRQDHKSIRQHHFAKLLSVLAKEFKQQAKEALEKRHRQEQRMRQKQQEQQEKQERQERQLQEYAQATTSCAASVQEEQWQDHAFVREWCGFPYFRIDSRFGYHHENMQSIRTTIDRGWDDTLLRVRIQTKDGRGTTFSLCSGSFPLRELFDTYLEQAGTSWDRVTFSYKDVPLRRDARPTKLGMELGGPVNVIKVSDVKSVLERRRTVLKTLNKMACHIKAERRVEAPHLGARNVSSALTASTLTEICR